MSALPDLFTSVACLTSILSFLACGATAKVEPEPAPGVVVATISKGASVTRITGSEHGVALSMSERLFVVRPDGSTLVTEGAHETCPWEETDNDRLGSWEETHVLRDRVVFVRSMAVDGDGAPERFIDLDRPSCDSPRPTTPARSYRRKTPVT